MLSDFDQLIAPISPERFRAEILGRQPLYIPAGTHAERRALLDWTAFNGLLGQTAAWTAQSLRLMMDRVPVPPSEYCHSAQTPAGVVLRPSPQKLAVFLDGGASAVANEVQTLHPPIAAAAAMLGRTFAAQVGANVYCSFKGIQAFGPHYDVHDVFAVQTEGEKVWRIYETQMELPVELPPDTAETREWLEHAHGRLVEEVLMKPGDVLYLPRGRFHDALTTDGASLHVTFSVTPLYGRSLLSLLEGAILQFPLFRQYLPPAGQDGGRALSSHLKEVGGFLADIIASPAFRDEVAMAQERLVLRQVTFDLPDRGHSVRYRTTGMGFPDASTAVRIAYDWCQARETFSQDQIVSEFDFIEAGALCRALDAAEATGALLRLY